MCTRVLLCTPSLCVCAHCACAHTADYVREMTKKREKSSSPPRARAGDPSASKLPPAPGLAAKKAPAAAAPSFDPTTLLPIALLFGWSKLNIDTSFETEEGQGNIFILRCAFYGVVLICLAMVAFMRSKITGGKPNLEKIEVVTPKTMAEPEKTEEMTITEYDLQQIKKLVGSILMPMCIISLMHFKWQFVRPLVLQSVMMPMTMAKSQLFKIHVLGQPAEGDLERPWAPPKSPLAQLISGDTGAEKTAKQLKNEKKKAAKKDKKTK